MRVNNDLKFTPEQLDIIYNDINNDLLIEAFAGSGKTTTLIEFCNQNFDKKILYLVFNRHMRKHAKFLFPINTQVHTLNSFVYEKMKKIFGKINVVDNINTSFIFLYSDVLKNYKNIEDKYILAAKIKNKFEIVFNNNVLLEYLNDSDVVDAAVKELYLKMYQKKIPFTHNVLSYIYVNYMFNKFNDIKNKFDIILVDEAQDLDLTMFNLINKFDSYKIFVGDKYQSIYGFRGNLNIFKEDNDMEKKYLTQTFRFGNNIASFVNDFMEIEFGEQKKIIGNKNIEDFVLAKKDLDDNFIKENIDNALICRTNAYLFEEAINYAKKGILVAIPYDWKETKQLLKDVYLLKIGVTSQIESNKIKSFQTYENFEKVLEMGADTDLFFLKKVIEKYDVSIFENINDLEKKLTNYKFADLILLTGHKSKGLEFDNVIIGDDFNKDKTSQQQVNNMEELNLKYVAYTRSRKYLFI